MPAPPAAAAPAARSQPPRCLVCNRQPAESELVSCQDAHAACPARPEVTYLDKVCAAAAPAGWPGGRADGDLVCPRCAALINDIVIYESRLLEMTERLVAMVTATLAARGGAAEATPAAPADKAKPRRPRKVPPKRSKPAETPAASKTAAGPGRPRRACITSVEEYGDVSDNDDEDDPLVVEDASEPAAAAAVPARTAPEPQVRTWLVSAESVEPRRRGRSSGPHTCHFCQKQLATSSSLSKHVLLHTDERRFKCAACDKAFHDSRGLRRHLVDHTGVRPYCCATCGKTLLSNYALKIHQRNHLGIKPAECHVCHKKMSSAQMLREHLRIHTGERPFSCEFCGRTFRTEKILSSHLRTHTGARPHVCPVCGRAFSQRTPLTAHMRSGHTAQQLAACRRERIGRTAIRTPAGIIDARDGSSVRPLLESAAPGDAGPDGGDGGSADGARPPEPSAASGGGQEAPGVAPLQEFLGAASGAGCGQEPQEAAVSAGFAGAEDGPQETVVPAVLLGP